MWRVVAHPDQALRSSLSLAVRIKIVQHSNGRFLTFYGFKFGLSEKWTFEIGQF